MRLPSEPSTTSARAVRRDWIPYEDERRVECACGSRPCLSAKVPSEAYWPAAAPTCHEASTDATPALRPAPWAAGAASSPAIAAIVAMHPCRTMTLSDPGL